MAKYQSFHLSDFVLSHRSGVTIGGGQGLQMFHCLGRGNVIIGTAE